MRMQGTRQLEREATIEASVDLVYELFLDNDELANWAPAVDAVVHEAGGDASGVGRVRTCAVTMGRRQGTMVEECVEAIAPVRASFVVVDDSFGFNKMLRAYGFTAHFAATDDERCSVRIETFYTPANPLAAVLNRLVLRRKFRGVVDDLLTGLGTVARQRQLNS
jgi:Polyketide cyclase / dehydrase and lipid transport